VEGRAIKKFRRFESQSFSPTGKILGQKKKKNWQDTMRDMAS
jgi:hypothetical protein